MPTQKITSAFFTENDTVRQLLDDLKNDLAKTHPDGKIYSDITDQYGNQYIDLVQEGGGVLGIALAGFTFVLEQNGIRFMRLAGTSAGAINSMLLAAINQKHEAKTPIMLEHLAALNLLDLVDGKPIVRRTLSRIMKDKHYIRNSLLFLGGLLVTLLLTLISNSIHHSFYLSLFIWVLMATDLSIILFALYLLRLLKRNKYGLSPGIFFEKWIEKILADNNIASLTDLEKKAITDYTINHSENARMVYANDKPDDIDLVLRNTKALAATPEASQQPLKSDIILITSDITTQRKVELPRMALLYWEHDKVNPAAFVRASMSIPVFFEPKIALVPQNNPVTKAEWKKLQVNVPPDEVSFVDGGIISNFPISVFHNAAIRTPRLPVFGLRLKDSDDAVPGKPYLSLGKLAGAIFSTVRFNYDKDFLQKYSFYDNYVSNIDVRAFNWLNFSMPPDEQLKLFIQGVDAACQYLKAFDWNTYKEGREKLYDDLQK